VGTPLAIVPLNPVACASLLVRVGDELRAVVIVKATFALGHERSAWPIAPEPIVSADEHVADHPTNSLLAASELVPALPGAGVVLHAVAHAPNGRAVSEMAVRVAVFQDGAAVLNKHLVVVGDRKKGGEPTPFTRMPIVYERAFGGPSVATNPAGVGLGGGVQPNVLDPRQPDKPAGFGPISPTWAPRAAAMRRLDGAAREADVSIFPADASFEGFQAAPVDQRIEPLRGDEWIVLDGLHPTQARIQVQLPFARALARFSRSAGGDLAPIELVADTLTVSADRLAASVVWRGHVVVSSVEEARALTVFAALEVPTVPIAWPAPNPAAKPAVAANAEAEAPAGEWPTEIPDTTSERDVTAIRAAIAEEWGRATVELERTAEVDEQAASRAPLPFTPSATPVLELAKPIDPEIRIARGSTGTIDADQRQVRRTLPFSGRRKSPGARSPGHRAEAEPDDPAADIRTRAEARARAGRSLADLALAGADLAHADLAGADLRGVDLSGAKLLGATLVGAKLCRADLSRAVLDGATLDGADLADARLERARGRDARLLGVTGAGASFARGDWDGANFSDAELDGADFSGASLTGSRFVAARLRGARFVDARGGSASFEGAEASGASFSGAALPGAAFRLATLAGATLEAAELGGARFDGARLEKASLSGAGVAGANFAGAHLRGANLGRVIASRADLAAADLRGADLQSGRLEGANFEEATLREANLSAADLSSARLDRADLRDANLTGATLSRSSREGTKMQGARLTGVVDDR
jgi:uncharacterized protein YjbI with pentapeptide repeats